MHAEHELGAVLVAEHVDEQTVRAGGRVDVIGEVVEDGSQRDISRAYPKDSRGEAYIAALQKLSADPQSIVAEVAAQVWANAHVATRKYV